MSTYLLITPTNDELYHYGVKGMKWRVHKAQYGMNESMSGGASAAEIDKIEEAEKEAQDQLNKQEAYNRYFSGKKGMTPAQKAFHLGISKRTTQSLAEKIRIGRHKIEQIRQMAEKMGMEFRHTDEAEEFLTAAMDMTPGDLAHHGILGMKWGIRRFQPYAKGARVKGGKEVGIATKVKQRFKSVEEAHKAKRVARTEAKAAKKAEAEQKAAEDFEAAKAKAIESGSAEDLSKFKGSLTNEEYNRALLRLQNEQRLAAAVAAEQKTVWDKIDKGMDIVNRLAGYAGTIANAKNKYDAMQEALHKKEREAEKERKTTEKNKFITNIDNITELNEGMDKYKLTPQEYQSAMNILANKKRSKIMFGTKEGGPDQDFEDQNKKAAKEKAAKEQADRDRWTAEQNFKQYQKAQRKEQERQAKEAWKKYKKEANKARDGEWRKDEPSSGANHKDGDAKREAQPKQEKTTQLLLTMTNNTPTKSNVDTGKKTVDDYMTRMANVRATYDIGNNTSASSSSKRKIFGARSTDGSASYKQQASLDFGGSKVSRFSAKTSTPSKFVTDTRQTVANTKAESARQKELDKKRRSRLQHSAEIGETFLEHHGIKGQKWGVRRFQDKNGRRTAAGIERAKNRRLLDSKDTITEGRSYIEKSSFSYKVDLDTVEAERRVMPDGSVIYPAIATVIDDFAKAGAGNPYPGPKGFDGLYDRVNPGYGEPGTTNNCPFVGAAMEIASRGYDVVARRSLGGTSVGAFRLWFKGADTQKCDTWDEMSSDLKNMDDGASGVMQGYYGSGLGSGCGGHTLHWRKENGKVIVADGQSHKEMDFDDVQGSYGFGSNGCFFTRLDTCEPNWGALAADGVLGVNNSSRFIKSKASSNTVRPNRAWSATDFYGYSDVQEYRNS